MNALRSAKAIDENGFVVTRPFPSSGLGANLTSISGAAWAANALGRRLLVDWRGMDELRDKEVNYFASFYEPLHEIDGVDVVYAGTPNAPDYVRLDGDLCSRVGPNAMAELLAAGASRPEPYLVLQAWHGLERLVPSMNEQDRNAVYLRLMRRLRPKPDIAAAIETFAERELAGRSVVAVNIRTGNGQFTVGSGYENRVDQSIFVDRERFLRHVQAACDRRTAALPKESRLDRRILVVTDCGWMHELLMRLPSAFARRITFPPPGVGHQFSEFDSADYTDHDSVTDTIADMHLMARCDALVYNTTTFNLYARLTTDRFGGNEEHVESRYYPPWSRFAKRLKARAARALRD